MRCFKIPSSRPDWFLRWLYVWHPCCRWCHYALNGGLGGVIKPVLRVLEQQRCHIIIITHNITVVSYLTATGYVTGFHCGSKSDWGVGVGRARGPCGLMFMVLMCSLRSLLKTSGLHTDRQAGSSTVLSLLHCSANNFGVAMGFSFSQCQAAHSDKVLWTHTDPFGWVYGKSKWQTICFYPGHL